MVIKILSVHNEKLIIEWLQALSKYDHLPKLRGSSKFYLWVWVMRSWNRKDLTVSDVWQDYINACFSLHKSLST